MNNDNMTPTQWAAKLISDGYSPEKVEQILRREGIAFPTIAGVLNEMLGKKNMSVEMLAGFSGMDPSTIHRILNRTRNPSRNGLIKLALALSLTLEETQVLIKSGNCSALSGTRLRDLVIMDGIINKSNYFDVNKALTEKGLDSLDSKG